MYNLTPQARARMSDEERKPIYEKYIKYLEDNHPGCVEKGTIRETLEKNGLGFFNEELGVDEVKPLDDYQLLCKMRTGETKIFDMKPYLPRGMWQALKDINVFNMVYAECGYIFWNDNIDLTFEWVLLHGIDD